MCKSNLDQKIRLRESDPENKNILFLCMSTLPGTFRGDEYTYEEGEYNYKFRCHSQLEAGTKTLLSKLYDDGERLDRIVILHTEECTHDSNVKEYQAVIGADKPISANEFYKQRIIQCVDGELGDDFFKFVSLYDKNTEKQDIFAAVPNVCKSIIGDSKPENITVYIDTQGGRRNETLVMNCVLNMLKLRNVHIGEYFAIDYNPSSCEHPIRNVTRNNIMIDLASSMKVFIETGRADELSNYYKKYKEIKMVKSIPEDEIIDQIKKLSETFSICNVASFRSNLTTLDEKFKEYEQVDEEKDPIFMHLFEDFKKAYEKLLGNHTVPDEIEWLLKHRLYQQALTITEASLPEYVLEPLLFNANECINFIKEYYNRSRRYSYRNRFNGDIYDLQDPYYYIFKILLKNTDCEGNEPINERLYLSEFTNLRDFTYQSRFNPDFDENGLKVQINSIFVQARFGGRANPNDKTQKIKELLKEYSEVKILRNHTNHGAATIAESDVREEIEKVLEKAKELRKDCEEVLNNH